MNDDYQLYLIDALEQVQSWDLPEEGLADAANAQARLMAGCCSQYFYEGQSSQPS
jgi:hypothetical protein